MEKCVAFSIALNERPEISDTVPLSIRAVNQNLKDLLSLRFLKDTTSGNIFLKRLLMFLVLLN